MYIKLNDMQYSWFIPLKVNSKPFTENKFIDYNIKSLLNGSHFHEFSFESDGNNAFDWLAGWWRAAIYLYKQTYYTLDYVIVHPFHFYKLNELWPAKNLIPDFNWVFNKKFRFIDIEHYYSAVIPNNRILITGPKATVLYPILSPNELLMIEANE